MVTPYCECHQPDGSWLPCPKDWCEPFDEDADPPDNHPHDIEREPEYWRCPYYRQDGSEGRHGPNTCSFGCWEEPACITNQPTGGWPKREGNER